MSKKKKVLIGLGIAAAVLIFLAIAAGVIFAIYSFFVGSTVEFTDPAQYETILSEYTNEKTGVHTGYIVYPESYPKNAREVSLYFKMSETFDEPACEFEFECVYSDKDYAAEVDRLKNITKNGQKLRVDTKNYKYPAYVASDANAYTYEYALLAGKNRIVYVLLATTGNKLHLSPDYMPKNYYKKTDVTNIYDTDEVFGWSIYMTDETVNKKTGRIESREYDYSR